jgi:long-chain acyl-CoA synthetase
MPKSETKTPTRVFDLLECQLQRFPRNDAFAHKVNGVWRRYSTTESVQIVAELTWGMHLLGIGKGDRVADTTETNRPEWNFIDNAVMSLGAVHVPIYPNNSAEEFEFILNDSEARMLFVSSERLFRLTSALRSKLPNLVHLHTYDPIGEAPVWTAVRSIGEKSLAEPGNREKLNQIKAAVQPEDLATLIYTSGTTGTPKGVMLSHKNLLSNCFSCSQLIPISHHDRALSFLPLCHIYERTMINIYVNLGAAIYYAENLDTIGENLREIGPQIISAVPRLLEKIYERFLARGNKLTGIKRTIYFRAVEYALEYDFDKPLPFKESVEFAIADRLVFFNWRAALGGRLRAIISGSAALRPQLARVFWAAGIPIYEGYGPTEASPVIAVNHEHAMKVGTVGPVLSGGEVRIAADGEILYRGPNVMIGYFKRPDLTAEAIDSEGWLHTGDVGMFDGPYLKITDRKKEIFKTSGGKYIAPQQVESVMKESKFIGQIMVVGEGHKFPAALIVPAFSVVRNALHKEADNEEIASSPEAYQLVESEITRLNGHLGHHSQIKKFVLLANEWSVTDGELTATLKLKRREILRKYAARISALYSETEPCDATLESEGLKTVYERARIHR